MVSKQKRKGGGAEERQARAVKKGNGQSGRGGQLGTILLEKKKTAWRRVLEEKATRYSKEKTEDSGVGAVEGTLPRERGEHKAS